MKSADEYEVHFGRMPGVVACGESRRHHATTQIRKVTCERCLRLTQKRQREHEKRLYAEVVGRTAHETILRGIRRWKQLQEVERGQ